MRTFTPKTSIAHNHNKMKKAILTFAAVVAAFVASADEGMWLLPYLQKMNIKDMKAKGCRLSADDIYSADKSSLKDAIVIFGGGEPLLLDGVMIGAIGVSGGTAEQDTKLGAYGKNILKDVI